MRHNRGHARAAPARPGQPRSRARSWCCRCWSSLVLVVAALALAAYDARRDARADRHRPRRGRGGGGGRLPDRGRRPSATADPAAVAAAVRRGGAPRHRRRLRRRDGPGPDPLHATPTPARSASRSSATSATRPAGPDLHPGVHRHAGPVDARGGPGASTRRPGRRAGLGRHHRRPRSTRSCAATLPLIAAGRARRAGRRAWPAPGWSAAGCAGRPTAWASARSPGCTSTTRAVLHAVREGLLLLDDRRPGAAGQRRGAAGCCGLPDDVVGRSVARPRPAARAWSRPRSGDTAETDDIYVAGEHVLVVSSAPASWQGREVGAVVTLRDHTELRAVTGELDVVRGLTESLRSQNHEAANRLHTVVSPHRDGPHRARPSTSPPRSSQVAQLLTDRVVGAVGDPVARRPAARQDRRGRRARHRAHGRPASCPAGADVAAARPASPCVGNLVDNALDAVAGRPRRAGSTVAARRRRRPAVAIVGRRQRPGPRRRAGAAACSSAAGRPRRRRRGGRGVGLALVGQVARRHGGAVEVGASAARRRASSPSRCRCARPVSARR